MTTIDVRVLDHLVIGRGQVVFAEGEPGDRLFVVVEGKVKLGQTSVDGREQVMAIVGPGGMFGELSLFDPGLRTSTATAVTDTVLLGLGQGDLRPWLTGRPEVAEALLRALAQRLSILLQEDAGEYWGSTLEYVQLGCYANPRAEEAGRARHWLERLGLGARLHQRFRTLSGGERQRARIAQD